VPFPGGTPLADFYPGNSKLAVPPAPGFSPNTRTLLQFRVKPLVGAPDTVVPLEPGDLAAASAPLLVPQGVMTPPPADAVRHLTLNEAADLYGRLAQLIGTNQPTGPSAFGLPYHSLPTETPRPGDIEVWYVYNLTADTHPLHFHLANCQILYRQAFNAPQFNGVANFVGQPMPPDPNEQGWKETVRMNPGEVTVVVMKFDLPADPVVDGQTVPVPLSDRLMTEYGIAGYEYVWHCHILEHEEHDMMRPLVVDQS
jgi:spore coat protein A